MSTSGSTNYSETRDQIISDSLQLLGVIGAGETATSNDTTFCSNMLNKMVKAWQGQGIHLWKECEATVALVNGQSKYTLSSSGTDYAGDNAIETQLTANANGASLTISSTTGMTASDNIGIQLDSGSMTWTTILSVDTSTTLTLSSSIGTASSGNTVITYTTHVGRPLNIINCRYHYQNGIDRKMKKMGRSEFDSIPTKTTTTSACTAFYYSPQLSNGLLYVWPVPNTAADVLHIAYIKSIEDFDSSTDDPDFPQEWLDVLTYNLAVRIAPAYGITLSSVNPDVMQTAAALLAGMLAWDNEEGSVKIVPNKRYD